MRTNRDELPDGDGVIVRLLIRLLSGDADDDALSGRRAMNLPRRGSMRSAGLIAVAVLAVLALVLIILKFKDTSSGPGVTAVPLTGGAAQRPANNPSAGNNPSAAASGAKKAVAGAVGDRDLEIQVIDAGR